MGIRSNFSAFQSRMEGIYGTNVSSDIDGRLLVAARRYRLADTAIRSMRAAQIVTLYAWAHHRMLGVMLNSRLAHELHEKSETSRNLADWLQRLERIKSRTWYQIRTAAAADVERAMGAFDACWRRHE
jgi:hypothetical protein